jgi:hypothetical protein
MRLTITNKKASATVLCQDLIADNRRVVCLSAYGPSQEVRAFAQILNLGQETTLESEEQEGGSQVHIYHAYCPTLPRIIPKMGEGYSGLYVLPGTHAFLIGNSTEECFGIFSRILDQKEFVHRDWYAELFPVLTAPVEVSIGSKVCFRYHLDKVKAEIPNRVRFGGLKIPPATAHFTIAKEAQDGQGTVLH